MIPASDIDSERPVLIAGPTASGKSALALEIVERYGGTIVNADALQVYANWRILTARPSVEDETRAEHRLYGHVARRAAYSVGHWLRDVAPLLAGPGRPVIVGGTGLYFTALTEGLVEIPPVPAEIRSEADNRSLQTLLEQIDSATRAQIDQANPARVRRAWEVLASTGKGLAAWQAETPAPLLPPEHARRFRIDAPKEWLSPRIDQRFDMMLAEGALEEARQNLDVWDPALPSSRAIGGPELIAHLRGETTLAEAREAARIATRQYAKRQRTWFRARMRDWEAIAPAA